MMAPLIPPTPTSVAVRGLISWQLVVSLLAFVMSSLALFIASGGTLNITELQGSPVPVQLWGKIGGEKPAEPLQVCPDSLKEWLLAYGGHSLVQVCKLIGAIAPPSRLDIAETILEPRKLEIGIQLGVQQGEFALHNLLHWRSCKRYYLVDIWKQQENYVDSANVANDQQEQYLAKAKENLQEYVAKTVWLRNYTTDAVTLIKEQVDFIYVDARHDYCGTKQDIELYYPLLKSGGVLAGHDYLDAPTVKTLSGQDWALCMNGTRHDGAVKSAVNEFATQHRLTLMVTYADGPWISWLAIKP